MKLNNEVLQYCKIQYKKGCGKCLIHTECTATNPISKDLNDRWRDNVNKAYDKHFKPVTQHTPINK